MDCRSLDLRKALVSWRAQKNAKEPYLSRLWCVFEVAAFRTANPVGKITLAPLFVEAAVAALWTSAYIVPLLYLLASNLLDLGSNYALPLSLLPMCVGFHILRSSFKKKRQLLEELCGNRAVDFGRSISSFQKHGEGKQRVLNRE